jgi:hypothetical protein
VDIHTVLYIKGESIDKEINMFDKHAAEKRRARELLYTATIFTEREKINDQTNGR